MYQGHAHAHTHVHTPTHTLVHSYVLSHTTAPHRHSSYVLPFSQLDPCKEEVKERGASVTLRVLPLSFGPITINLLATCGGSVTNTDTHFFVDPVALALCCSALTFSFVDRGVQTT